MKRLRCNHSAAFKAKVTLAALKSDQTLAQLAERFDVHPNQVTQWKAELFERAAEVFATAAKKREAGPDVKALHAKIGQQMLHDMLRLAGHRIGRKHVATLVGKKDIDALYRKANTSGGHPVHRIYPYLLRGLVIDQPNQVWAMDTTYIPMRQGFVYLRAVLDWASRRVLAWRVSNNIAAYSCIEALKEAIHRYRAPQIMNTDQGGQYTSSAFISMLEAQGIHINMDGKGRWHDNVFIERLWRSIKYDEFYLLRYNSVTTAKAGIARYALLQSGAARRDGLTPQNPLINP